MVYRQEHPNPQWERKNWRNLNGIWEFDFDFGKSALNRKLYEKDEKLSKEINIPFCPESKLSGIGYTDFINGVCYRKIINISKEELSGRVILHFGAVDYESYIFVNKKQVKKHIGGYSSFEVDITDELTIGENVIFVIVKDDMRADGCDGQYVDFFGKQPSGKQSSKYESYGCFYTRTTGIWQTVWLEFVPKSYIKSAKYYTDTENGILTIKGCVLGKGEITAKASFEGKPMGETTIKTNGGSFIIQIKLSEINLWEVGKGGLYDLELIFSEDVVKSYFGLRSVRLEDKKFLINEKSVFQRLVLDQGFYPDGIYTAKSEEELVLDIHLSMNAGFNGARLHEKIFEPRFLYHCDKLGYIVWGEYPNWGVNLKIGEYVENVLNEWGEEVERDFNHPSIIGWCPLNETWAYKDEMNYHAIETIYRYTKSLDETRPCIDSSWTYHIMTDIYDIHEYQQNPEKFKEYMEKLDNEGIFHDGYENQQIVPYNNEPTFVSEYGGILLAEDDSGWGYGDGPKNADEFLERYEGLTNAILDSKSRFGFCYTQLYDVEQEQNGLYTYQRKPKVDIEIIRKINTRKAAIEE